MVDFSLPNILKWLTKVNPTTLIIVMVKDIKDFVFVGFHPTLLSDFLQNKMKKGQRLSPTWF